MAGEKIYPPWKPKREAWHPPDYDDRVIYAVRNFERGKASEGQQQLLWRWLMYVTEVGGLPYRPGRDGVRDTDFALGKMFVGRALEKMLHPELTPDDGEAPPPAAERKRKRTR